MELKYWYKDYQANSELAWKQANLLNMQTKMDYFHLNINNPTSQLCGSGHETAAVLLPGFAISW